MILQLFVNIIIYGQIVTLTNNDKIVYMEDKNNEKRVDNFQFT